jgi:hypothetical protein
MKADRRGASGRQLDRPLVLSSVSWEIGRSARRELVRRERSAGDGLAQQPRCVSCSPLAASQRDGPKQILGPHLRLSRPPHRLLRRTMATLHRSAMTDRRQRSRHSRPQRRHRQVRLSPKTSPSSHRSPAASMCSRSILPQLPATRGRITTTQLRTSSLHAVPMFWPPTLEPCRRSPSSTRGRRRWTRRTAVEACRSRSSAMTGCGTTAATSGRSTQLSDQEAV